jgi:hypothetical protein
MTHLSRKEEIERRLKEIEKERNTLLQELAVLPSVQESPQLPSLLGSVISESPPATSEERIALFTRLFPETIYTSSRKRWKEGYPHL